MEMFKKGLGKKVKGFVITFEVMMAIVAFAFFLKTTVYSISSYNIQRFMHTTATTTLTRVAKLGGTDSNPANLEYGTSRPDGDPVIIRSAQNELNRLMWHTNPRITGGPERVSKEERKVWIELNWEYPTFFGLKIGEGSVKLEMDSIMRPGELVR